MLEHIKKDYRISPDQLEFLDIDQLSVFDSVTIGHTSCIHKLLGSDIHYHINELSSRVNRVAIELPVIFGSQRLLVEPLIVSLVKKGTNLIVNDWGTMQMVVEICTASTTVGIGRALTMGMSSCPWIDDIMADEDEGAKSTWQELPLDSELFTCFLSDKRIFSVDLSVMPGNETLAGQLSKAGFTTFCFSGTRIHSISRVCAFLKYGHSSIGECQHLCRSATKLTVNDRWHRFDGSFTSIGIKASGVIGALDSYGNIVTSWVKNNNTLNTEGMDYISIDGRFGEKYDFNHA
jgi:hypothetical protein